MWFDYALVAGGAFVAAVVTGSTGFAFALIATAVWLHVLPPGEIVLLASICATLLHALSVWRFRREIEYRLLWPFLVGAFFGVPLGVLALRNVDATVFRDFIGVFTLAYTTYAFARPQLPVVRLTPTAARVADGGVGWAAGIIGGVAMLHGLLPTIWCALRGWDKRRGRFVYQPYILCTGVFVMILVGLNVEIDRARVGTYLAVALPALGAGLWVGLRVFDWISEVRFRRLVLALLFASGVALLL